VLLSTSPVIVNAGKLEHTPRIATSPSRNARDLNAALYAIARVSRRKICNSFLPQFTTSWAIDERANFYIALYIRDPVVELPYFVDEQDPPGAEVIGPRSD